MLRKKDVYESVVLGVLAGESLYFRGESYYFWLGINSKEPSLFLEAN